MLEGHWGNAKLRKQKRLNEDDGGWDHGLFFRGFVSLRGVFVLGRGWKPISCVAEVVGAMSWRIASKTMPNWPSYPNMKSSGKRSGLAVLAVGEFEIGM